MFTQYVQEVYRKLIIIILAVVQTLMLCACSNNSVRLEDNIEKLKDNAKDYFSLDIENNYGEHFQIKAEVKKTIQTESSTSGNRQIYNYEYTLYILPIYEESVKLKDIKVTVENDRLTTILKDNGILLPNYDLPYFELTKKESKLEEYTCQIVTFNISLYENLLSENDMTVDELEKILTTINVELKYNLFSKDSIIVKPKWVE